MTVLIAANCESLKIVSKSKLAIIFQNSIKPISPNEEMTKNQPFHDSLFASTQIPTKSVGLSMAFIPILEPVGLYSVLPMVANFPKVEKALPWNRSKVRKLPVSPPHIRLVANGCLLYTQMSGHPEQ